MFREAVDLSLQLRTPFDRGSDAPVPVVYLRDRFDGDIGLKCATLLGLLFALMEDLVGAI